MTQSSEIFVDDKNKHLVLGASCQSIVSGFASGQAFEPTPASYPQQLQELRATYVTLKLGNELRGCVGHLEAKVPLIVDASFSAFAAAFRDSRFAPLTAEETEHLSLHISVLSPLEKRGVLSEHSMHSMLSPGEDGVVIELGPRRACFLPVMWDRFESTEDFVSSLKSKAGLPSDYWSTELMLYTFRTQSFTGPFYRPH